MGVKWRKVKGYKGKYLISSKGHVYSVPRVVQGRAGGLRQIGGRSLTTFVDGGYFHVTLCQNNTWRKIAVHKLVARSFIPNPENKPEVNHKDGIKTNNRTSNLEWVTRKENAEHASRTGLLKGPRGKNNKIPRSAIKLIRLLCRKGYSQSLFAEIFGVDQSTISDVVTRRTWRHVA